VILFLLLEDGFDLEDEDLAGLSSLYIAFTSTAMPAFFMGFCSGTAEGVGAGN